MVLIRDAIDDDVGALVDLIVWGSLQAQTNEDPQHRFNSYARALADINSDSHSRLLVAVNTDCPIGMVQIYANRHFQHQGGLCAEIESLYVHPDRRRLGIGRALLMTAITQARAWGCYRVQLTSDARRRAAHKFYEREGFKRTHLGYKLTLSETVRAKE